MFSFAASKMPSPTDAFPARTPILEPRPHTTRNADGGPYRQSSMSPIFSVLLLGEERLREQPASVHGRRYQGAFTPPHYKEPARRTLHASFRWSSTPETSY